MPFSILLLIIFALCRFLRVDADAAIAVDYADAAEAFD